MNADKIIINGIDVSECEYLNSLDNGISECILGKKQMLKYRVCDCNHNCYFKQLARAKEEIKKLKVQIENEKQALQINIDNLNQACLDLNQENDDLQNKLQAKEQEFEELKEKIRREVQEDVTCESRECGCDSSEECIECLKNTILNIINDERNDFVQDKVICKECGKYKQELKPFKDPYFKGLDNQIIAELAKKSIRLSTENRKLEDALDEIEKIAKNDCENCCECTTEFNLQESCSIYEIQNIINKANTAPTTIFDRIRSFDSDTLARFIHALISCHEKYTCDDCYIASLPFQRRICDTKETLEEIKAWLNEEFKE